MAVSKRQKRKRVRIKPVDKQKPIVEKKTEYEPICTEEIANKPDANPNEPVQSTKEDGLPSEEEISAAMHPNSEEEISEEEITATMHQNIIRMTNNNSTTVHQVPASEQACWESQGYVKVV